MLITNIMKSIILTNWLKRRHAMDGYGPSVLLVNEIFHWASGDADGFFGNRAFRFGLGESASFSGLSAFFFSEVSFFFVDSISISLM